MLDLLSQTQFHGESSSTVFSSSLKNAQLQEQHLIRTALIRTRLMIWLLGLMLATLDKIKYEVHLTNDYPSLQAFVIKLLRSTKSSLLDLALGIVYLNRFVVCLPDPIDGHCQSPYRLILVSILIARKIRDDSVVKNSEWVKMMHPIFTKNDIQNMERLFLVGIGYNLYVTFDDIMRLLSIK